MPAGQIAVVGAGLMGAGIAQVAAQAGYDVLLCDTSATQLDAAMAAIAISHDRFVAKKLRPLTWLASVAIFFQFLAGLDLPVGVAATVFAAHKFLLAMLVGWLGLRLPRRLPRRALYRRR